MCGPATHYKWEPKTSIFNINIINHVYTLRGLISRNSLIIAYIVASELNYISIFLCSVLGYEKLVRTMPFNYIDLQITTIR